MRHGRKGQPFYRIVAVDSRKKRDGAFIEKIGHYNPNASPAELIMDEEKALKWLRHGAIPSDTVRSLLSRRGVMLQFDLNRRGLSVEEINSRVTTHRQLIENKLHAKEEAARPKPAPEPIAEVSEVQAQPEAPPAEQPPAESEPAAAPETSSESGSENPSEPAAAPETSSESGSENPSEPAAAPETSSESGSENPSEPAAAPETPSESKSENP
jgi:small subunit ribosomal protein S16